MAKIVFTPSKELKELLERVDALISRGKANPFRNEADKHDYLHKLGCIEFIDNETTHRKG